MKRRMFRQGRTGTAHNNKYAFPHQSARERERRLRQIARGQLTGHPGFITDALAVAYKAA